MEYLTALLKLGVWFAVYPLGAWTLASVGPETRCLRSNPLIALCVGSAIVTVVMMTLALAGAFSPIGIGAIGWLIAAAWCWRTRPWRDALPALRAWWPRGSARGTSLALAVIVAVASVLYAFFPKESLLGERDEGIYAQHALHLIRTGGSAIDLRALGVAEDPRIAAIESGKAPELPGIYPTRGHWTFQFSSATPVWMAMLGSVLGAQGIFRFNAIVGVLNCFAFLVLVRRMLKPSQRAWAVAALAVFALQPAQMWISRNSLSEPFCSWFLLNGAALAMIALARRSRSLGMLSGALIGMAGFVRVDALIFPLAISVAWLVAVALGRGRRGRLSNPILQEITFGCVAVQALALGYFLAFVQPYLLGLSDRVLGAVVATVLCSFLARSIQTSSTLRLPAVLARRGALPVAFAVIAVFAYALWIRPHLQPYALIESKLVPQLNGQRDWREASLVNIAAYLSMPVVLFAGAGVALAAASAWRGSLSTGRVWAMAFLLLPMLVYVWQPMVSPDHIWASRRWAPAVFPAFIVFAALGFAASSRHLIPRYTAIIAIVAGAALATNLLWVQRDTLWLREDAGMLAQIRAIAERLPKDQVSYVAGSDPLASALLIGFGAPVVLFVPTPDRPWSRICDAGRKSCLIVHPQGMGMDRSDQKVIAELKIRRPRRVVSLIPLAHGTREDTSYWTITALGH